MNKKQISEALSGSELPFELPHDIRVELQVNNLVIAYLSSSSVIFEGSIENDVEFDIYEDNFIYLNNGVIEKCNDNYCPHQKNLEDKAVAKIEISEHETEDRLFLKTDIPHETFKMFFSGELESVGIVFSMEYISHNDVLKEVLRDLNRGRIAVSTAHETILKLM